MESTFRQIQCIAEDIRLNTINTPEIKEFKLRQIEDICIKSLIALNDIRHRDN